MSEPIISEVWKPVVGYEGLYEVSNMGRIKSLVKANPAIMTPRYGSRGYKNVLLSKSGERHTFTVHRLVATAFCKRGESAQCVNHLDGNKLNNVADNLEWTTFAKNILHDYRVITPHRADKQRGERNAGYRKDLRGNDVVEMSLRGLSTRKIASIKNTSHTTIRRLLRQAQAPL